MSVSKTPDKIDFSKVGAALNKPKNTPHLLTAAQFARAVDTSEAEVLRKHRAGIFVAAKSNRKGGRNAKTYFTLDQVAEYKKRVAVEQAMADPFAVDPHRHYSAEQAQACFRALREHKTLEDCVIELGLHPSTAKEIAREWALLRRCMFVSGDTLAAIEELGPTGPLPISSPEDLLEVVRLAADEAKCVSCKQSSRVFCRSCARRRSQQREVETTLQEAAATIARVPEAPRRQEPKRELPLIEGVPDGESESEKANDS